MEAPLKSRCKGTTSEKDVLHIMACFGTYWQIKSRFAKEGDDYGDLHGSEDADGVGVEAGGSEGLLKLGIAPYPVAQGAGGTPGREVGAIELSQLGEAVTTDLKFLHFLMNKTFKTYKTILNTDLTD